MTTGVRTRLISNVSAGETDEHRAECLYGKSLSSV